MKIRAHRSVKTLAVIPLLMVAVASCSNNNPAATLSTEAADAKSRLGILLDSFIAEPNVENTMVSVSNGESDGSFSVSRGEAMPGVPMTAEHQFHIASMSKPFTATLLLQLIEEGYFELDAPLSEIFENLTMSEIFPDHNFSRVNADGVAVADMTVDQLHSIGGQSFGGTITIKQLMQHSHGMPDLTFDAPTGDASLADYTISKFAGFTEVDTNLYPDQWSGTLLLEYYLASGLATQSFFEPGQGYHYGDTGPVIAALIIERVTGMSLADAYRTRIFDPLEMHDTYLHHYEEPRQSSSAGTAHRYFDLSVFDPTFGNVNVDEENWNTSIDWAGGGLVSTASDLERFHRALFTGQLLLDSTVIGAVENRVDGDEEAPVYGLGFGLHLDAEDDTVVSYEHGGFWGSYMMYFPGSDRSLSFTANQVIFDRYDEFLTEVRSLYAP